MTHTLKYTHKLLFHFYGSIRIHPLLFDTHTHTLISLLLSKYRITSFFTIISFFTTPLIPRHIILPVYPSVFMHCYIHFYHVMSPSVLKYVSLIVTPFYVSMIIHSLSGFHTYVCVCVCVCKEKRDYCDHDDGTCNVIM